MRNLKFKLFAGSLGLVLAVIISFALFSAKSPTQNEPVAMNSALLEDYYSSRVQSVFNQRCIACHSCFNAPCQMDLTSFRGVERGGSHDGVYDFPLKDAKPPTRIGIDASTEKAWRAKGFHTVLQGSYGKNSILETIANPHLGANNTPVDADRKNMCPDSAATLDAYFKNDPGGRMPLGFPALTSDEFAVLKAWIETGAKGPTKEAETALTSSVHPKAAEILKSWEDQFNQTDFKNRLVSRYIYEHLFAAHLKVEGVPGEVYRLVRAKPGVEAVEEIPSRRPYDDIGEAFVYRLKKYSNTVVSKTHLLYSLDEVHRTRWKETFFGTEWEEGPEVFPKYGPSGANAFVTFKKIPVAARYRFLLDDAYYHISTFIKGPVCRGQTALNVINDHFWVVFLDPKFDVVVNDKKLYAKMAPLMNPPAKAEDEIKLFKSFREGYWGALQLKYKAYEASKATFSREALWNANSNSLLTVYRHFDSAQVMKGAWGEVPETAWVLDYQVFEDIYYNLVAGYDVFGPLIHQLNTRLYMDISRISSEDMYLNFLPSEARAKVRSGWYRDTPESKKSVAQDLVDLLGGDVKTLSNRTYPYLGSKLASTETVKKHEEFLPNLLADHFGPEVRANADGFNRGEVAEGVKAGSRFDREWLNWQFRDRHISEALRKIAGRPGKFARHFADTAILRVRSRWGAKTFTIVHNKAHLNVSLLLFEDERRDVARDTLNFIPGFATSYPNEFYEVAVGDLEEFADELAKVESPADFKRWKKPYAINRHDRQFWPMADELNDENVRFNLADPGYLDLSRYVND